VGTEHGHGRHDIRHYHVVDGHEIAKQFPQWPALKTVGVAVNYRQEKGKAGNLEYRYYISSAVLTEEEFATAVRGHWAIENSLHWVLDATMREDACQIYRSNAARNIAGVRQLALNMLRAEKIKVSIRKKQKRAWMKTDFLSEVLKAGLSELGKK